MQIAVAEVAKDHGLMGNEQTHSILGRKDGLSGKDYARVQSILWDLTIEGVVRPGLHDEANDNLPLLHVTEWDKKAINDGGASPYEPPIR